MLLALLKTIIINVKSTATYNNLKRAYIGLIPLLKYVLRNGLNCNNNKWFYYIVDELQRAKMNKYLYSLQSNLLIEN